MIEYLQEGKSPFFDANKIYCERIETELKGLGYSYTGFCNSYGYLVDTSFTKNSLTYRLKYIKEQTTRGGGTIIGGDAADYAGAEFSIDGLSRLSKIDYGNNRIKRLLLKKKFKDLVAEPFYISSSLSVEEIQKSGILKVIKDNKIDALKLDNGKLVVKMHDVPENLFGTMEEIAKCFSFF